MRRALAALVVVVLLSLAGCSDDTPSAGDKGYVDGKGIVTRLAPDERRELAGPLEGETLEGDAVTQADLEGKVTVVNVWYATCPPCRKEAPLLAEVADQLTDDDVVFLGINNRDTDQSQALAFQRRFEVPYPTLWDPTGRTLLSFAGTLPPNAVPSTVVLDREGRVAASIIGEVTSASTLTGLVEDVRDGVRS